MRFKQLEYFEMAVRVGSLRRAAIELGISQPTLSQQIQRLEEELNVVLLFRAPTGVVATDAGRSLLPHVRQALRAENELRQEASEIAGLRQGKLRAGVIPTASHLFLLRAVRKFQETYPGIAFEVIEAGSGQISDWLISGEVDVGVLGHWEGGTMLSTDELQSEVLASGFYSICVPPGHRLAEADLVRVEDLAGESFVVVEQGQVLREIFEKIASQVKVKIVYETNSSLFARRAVDAGIGISIQSALGATQGEGHESIAIRLAESWATGSVVLMRRRFEQPTHAAVKFIQVVREAANALNAHQRQ